MAAMWENAAFDGMVGAMGVGLLGLLGALLQTRKDLRAARMVADTARDADITKRFEAILTGYDRLIESATKDVEARKAREAALLAKIDAMQAKLDEMVAEIAVLHEALRAQGVEPPPRKPRRSVQGG